MVGVEGLSRRGAVVNGPDLSYESQAPDLLHLDAFGHGTHLAGIIAAEADEAVGVAPDSHLVSLKVAAHDGATDVPQVIAAIDWVVQHRNDPGMNIRVFNLAYGTDGVQDRMIDRLAYAVEVAWRHGIVVVVSAGNDGAGARVTNPAISPFVLTVGATDPRGTDSVADDVLADFTSTGDGSRSVDVVAPGKSIASLPTPSAASTRNTRRLRWAKTSFAVPGAPRQRRSRRVQLRWSTTPVPSSHLTG